MKSKESLVIRNTILEMETPFFLSILFKELQKRYKITDRMLILEELSDLLDCGLVTTAEFVDDIAMYQSSLPIA